MKGRSMREKTTEVDPVKNRIVIYFDGFMTLEEAQMLKEAYRKAIDQVRPGFTVITYAIDYKPLGGMQIDRLAKTVTSYESQHFATFEEAEAYLDSEV